MSLLLNSKLMSERVLMTKCKTSLIKLERISHHSQRTVNRFLQKCIVGSCMFCMDRRDSSLHEENGPSLVITSVASTEDEVRARPCWTSFSSGCSWSTLSTGNRAPAGRQVVALSHYRLFYCRPTGSYKWRHCSISIRLASNTGDAKN